MNQPPLPPIPQINPSTNKNKKRNANKSLSPLSFDMRRVRKIRRLDRKIRSISSGTSKELQREIEKIKKERTLKLEQLSEAQASEINDSRSRYNLYMQEIEKEMNEKKKILQNHCSRELQRIKTRILNNHKNAEKSQFSIRSIRDHKIKICVTRKYSIRDIRNDILSVFNNWQNEIQFNTKRATRAATKNKKTNIYGSTDLSRIRFHLKEDEIKYDLRILLDAEHENNVNHYGYGYRNYNYSDTYPEDMEEDITNAFHQQPSYIDRHISGITNKLGPLNDPGIEDPLYPRSRRRGVARVNYEQNNGLDGHGDGSYRDNISMYHAQEVHFYDNYNYSHGHGHGGNIKIVCSYSNNDGEMVEIPMEERGHNVVISSFTVKHGSVVRLNYLGNNTTIDAMVVSIKKAQLSAVTLVGKKRKRIWYKELRIGKINIAPATAYR